MMVLRCQGNHVVLYFKNANVWNVHSNYLFKITRTDDGKYLYRNYLNQPQGFETSDEGCAQYRDWAKPHENSYLDAVWDTHPWEKKDGNTVYLFQEDWYPLTKREQKQYWDTHVDLQDESKRTVKYDKSRPSTCCLIY